MESYALVAVQFLSAAILIYLTLHVPLNLFAIIMITIAIAVALWAILAMRMGNFRINPIPKEKAKLVTNGPYNFIRHPMYAAVLIAMIGIAINTGTWFSYILWFVLFIDLYMKMQFEEKLLLMKFSEYEKYMRRTKRFLPFLW